MAKRYVGGPTGGAYMAYDYLFGPNQQWLKDARQVGAGLHELVTADVDKRKGHYKPAIIPQTIGIPAMVKSYMPSGQASTEKTGKPFSGNNIAERVLNQAYEEMDVAREAGNELAGVSDPTNLKESLLRYGLPNLIRGPVGLLGTTSKGGKILKTLNKTPGIIRKPVKVAAELATPFRQTKLSTAVPLASAVHGTLDVIMDKGTTADGQEYDGTVPELVRGLTGRDNAPVGSSKEEQAQLQELDQLMLNDAYEAGEITDEEIDAYIASPPSVEDEAATDSAVWNEKAKDAGIFLTAALGATVGHRRLGKIAKTHLEARKAAINDPRNVGKFDDPDDYAETAPIDVDADVPERSVAPAGREASEGEPQYVGTKWEGREHGLGDRAIGGAFEKTRPITTMADRFLGRNQAKKFGFRLDALTNSSIQARFSHWLRTGEAPGSNMRTESLGAWSRTFADELDGAEQLRVNDALVAASSLDDINRTGNHASLFEDKFGNRVNPRQMQQLVDSVKADPKLGKYFTQIQKFYDDKLRYEVDRGLISQADYAKMRAERPNYVPLKGNLQQEAPYSPFSMRYSANEDAKNARNLLPETGLKGSEGVANPLSMLFEQWSDTIRRAETNEFRREYLEKMSNAGARKKNGDLVVRKLRGDQTGRDVHEVQTPTGVVRYDVTDSQLASSLHLSPRETVKYLEEMRQMYQNFTTGAVATGRNLFGLVAAPIMDSMAASTLAGKSHKVGLANRLFAGGHIGGIRAAGDMIGREMATRMRMHMIRENSWLRDMLNKMPNGAERFTTFLENHYKQSTLADMDRMGITSKSAWGSQDPTHVMEGLEGQVPEYARQQSQRVIDDINESLNDPNGGIGAIRGRMSKINKRWVQAKTMPFIRQYGGLLEAMHNGARYQAVRANKGRVRDLDEFISDMRRLSADPSIHGSSKAVNYLASANLYGPISLATLAQVGKRFREDPLNFGRNVVQTGATAAAMFYLSQYYDEEARAKHQAKTPQQRANKLTMFGGAELPLDQLQRLFLGGVMPITDQMSGMNTGEWDEGFIKSMQKMVEGEGPQMDEEAWKDWEMRFNEALRANMPSSLLAAGVNLKPEGGLPGIKYTGDASSIPPLQALMGVMGVDPGMSTLTGEVVGPKTQKITGLEADADRPESLVGSQQEVIMRTLFSSAGAGLLEIAEDAWRLLNDKDPDNDKRAMQMVTDQWKEGAQKGAGPLKPLFGDRAEGKSAADTNYALLKDRDKGIETANNFLTLDYKTGDYTSASRSSARIGQPIDPSAMELRTDLAGTEMLHIGSMANRLYIDNNKAKEEIRQISKRIESIKAATNKTISEKNAEVNPLVDEVKYRRMLMLQSVREYEETISQDIGREFTFEDFNPEEYLRPFSPPQ